MAKIIDTVTICHGYSQKDIMISPHELENYLWSVADQLRSVASTHEAMECLTSLLLLRFLSDSFEKKDAACAAGSDP